MAINFYREIPTPQDPDLGVNNALAQAAFHDIYHDGFFDICRWHESKTVSDLLKRAMQRCVDASRRRNGGRMKAVEADMYFHMLAGFVEELVQSREPFGNSQGNNLESARGFPFVLPTNVAQGRPD